MNMGYHRLTALVVNLILISSNLNSICATNSTDDEIFDGPGMNTRLVGAIEAEMHSAPYLVAVMVKSRTRGLIQFCGGALIRSSYVLTAAHCLKLEPHRLHMISGLHNVNNLDYWTTQRRRCEHYVKHPKFTTIGPYDVGIMRTNIPFKLNNFVQPIPLSLDSDPVGNVIIYGWGSVEQSLKRVFPNRLRVASLTLVTYKYCQASFPTQKVQKESNLCAGLPDYLSSACVGDSGGPAVQNGKLIGVVSWGPSNCNSESGPTILTSAAYYFNWIQQNVRLISLNFDSKPGSEEIINEQALSESLENSINDIVDDNIIDDLLNDGIRPGSGYVIMKDDV